MFARRRSRAESVERAHDYIELLNPLVRPTNEDLRRALDLFDQHETLGCFHAVLAAVAIGDESIRGLCSADVAFVEVRGLDTFDPADPDFSKRLGIHSPDENG